MIYAVPGVPSEMREMVSGTVLPDLRRRSGQAAVIRARVLRTWGMSESGLAEVLASRIDELDRLGNPTLAFQASGIDGIKVRIVAKCDDEAAAARILDAEEALIRGVLGEVIFGVDEQSMEAVVLDLLRRKGLTLAVAETVTGGLLSARLSAVDWAMETFRGGRVPQMRRRRRAGRSGARSRPRQKCDRSSAPAWPRRGGRVRARASRPARCFWPSTLRDGAHREGDADAGPAPHARILRHQPAQPAAPDAVGVNQGHSRFRSRISRTAKVGSTDPDGLGRSSKPASTFAERQVANRRSSKRYCGRLLRTDAA